MEVLKPCPFCGGESVYESTQPKHDIVYSIYCEECGQPFKYDDQLKADLVAIRKEEVEK